MTTYLNNTSSSHDCPSALGLRSTVLVFSDDALLREACCDIAASMGFRTERATNSEGAREWIKAQIVDIAIVHIPFNGNSRLEFLSEIHERRPETVIVSMGTSTAVGNVVEAMRRGADDYLPIPFTVEDLSQVLSNAAQVCTERRETSDLESGTGEGQKAGRLIFKSRNMESLMKILPRVAQSAHPVLILGESGTGKERVARGIHEISPDAERPFVSIDCSRSNTTLIEKELFGIQSERPLGAHHSGNGLLAAAQGGVVFLDEVGELPLSIQTKLIQAMRNREIWPSGAVSPEPIRTRIIAASNHDLGSMVSGGTFRKDLFYQLNVVCLRIPPLRERREDIPLLIAHFLARNNLQRECVRRFTWSNEFFRAMMSYDWPGNVRELENVVNRACALAEHSKLQACDLPSVIRIGDHPKGKILNGHDRTSEIIPLREVEHEAILQAITLSEGDKQKAAKCLGIGKTTLYRKLIEYGHDAELSRSQRLKDLPNGQSYPFISGNV